MREGERGSGRALNPRRVMALMFPPSFPSNEPADVADAMVFAALRNRLNDGWQVFYDRTIEANGEKGRIDFVALHSQRGIAALAVADADMEIDFSAAELSVATMLREHGFLELFDSLPRIAGLAIPPDGRADVLKRLEEALPTMTDARPNDPDWVEWTADRLSVESDFVPRDRVEAAGQDRRAEAAIEPPKSENTKFKGGLEIEGGVSGTTALPTNRLRPMLLVCAGLAVYFGASVWVPSPGEENQGAIVSTWRRTPDLAGHDVSPRQAETGSVEPLANNAISGTTLPPGAVLRLHRIEHPLVPHEWWKHVSVSLR